MDKKKVGQKPGGHHNEIGRREFYNSLLRRDKFSEIESKFDSLEENIKKCEKYLSWREDLSGTVSITEEFKKFFGL